MTRWLHTVHCPRSLLRMAVGVSRCLSSPLLCNNLALEQIPGGMFHISMGSWDREIGSKPPTHSLLHWNESLAKNIEMSVGPEPCQGSPETWDQTFLSHSQPRAPPTLWANLKTMMNYLDQWKLQKKVWKLCKIFRKSGLLSVRDSPLMFTTLLALHTNGPNKLWGMFGKMFVNMEVCRENVHKHFRTPFNLALKFMPVSSLLAWEISSRSFYSCWVIFQDEQKRPVEQT